jgi:hypothetical protein
MQVKTSYTTTALYKFIFLLGEDNSNCATKQAKNKVRDIVVKKYILSQIKARE